MADQLKFSSKQKKRIKRNNEIIMQNVMISLGITLFHLFITYLWTGISYSMMFCYFIWILSYAAVFFMLHKYAKPIISGSVEDLEKVTGSIAEFYFDAIYINWISQVLSLISGYFFLLWFATPALGGWKAWKFIQPFLGMKNQLASMQQQQQQQQPKQKVKYVRR
jgi:ABC-type multidrug transport system fused ATPase/permease subunit